MERRIVRRLASIGIILVAIIIVSAGTLYAADRYGDIIVKKLRVQAGGLTMIDSGTIDLNGNGLTLDADADTSITADTDDQIDIEIASTDEYTITATIFDIGGGANGNKRIDFDEDNDTSIRASLDDQIDIEVGGSDTITFTASGARIDGDLEFGGDLIASQQTVIAVTMGIPITPTGTYQAITSTTYTAAGGTSEIAPATINGNILILHNINATQAITIDGTGGTVECKADVVLGAEDTLTLVWSRTDWNCLANYDNS